MQNAIKYYGGKAGMTKFLLPLFPKDYDVFVDAFGGSASVLLAEERPKVIEIYNDLGENVYALYKTIGDEETFKQLQMKLELTPYSEQFRREYKEKLKEKDLSLLDRAFYFMYVNRTSFNGVGGFSTTLFKRRDLSKEVSVYLSSIAGLEELHQRLSSVVFEHKDIFKILDKYDKEDSFIYLDPPYVHDTRLSGTRYEVEMTNDEHERFVNRLLTMKAKVMVSGYDNNIYEPLNKHFHRYEFVSPLSRSNKTEVVWLNYDVLAS